MVCFSLRWTLFLCISEANWCNSLIYIKLVIYTGLLDFNGEGDGLPPSDLDSMMMDMCYFCVEIVY